MTFLEALKELTEKKCVSIAPKGASKYLRYSIGPYGVLAIHSGLGIYLEPEVFLGEWEIIAD